MQRIKFYPKNGIVLRFLPLIFLLLTRCGVKGDPIPPDTPPPIGHGKSSFKRAFKEIKKVPASALKPGDRQDINNQDEDSGDDDGGGDGSGE